ncbi:type I methionyl aminopeptidase [Candidatus Aminicenantes bacterium AC-708-M15]|nr:type I methionyl aminopeptidase [SCandidatus Aminicenantes bacterium Aminicenantia_JdfR_composite]MCP2598574.1 type I methionyl aminopeptidase [Candidatus Aminicenantes bacterium AC-335-L06]MCP2604082.1 type I methionyl aminopeptidase [Candidatus Aminicenantes bacterium AC-708-M15]MCP2605371.1 type I methionyl aminopeptidase [Candidatus Aminicenantes bacterium AC-335-O07]MCP2606018.1 type I methionyl aminopeptidase [Candidatus Aminicenantes bacterium AC-708-I09]MCP2617862.1 type I methionyl
MIIYKTEEEIECMKEANYIVAKILHELKEMIRPGIKTIELERYANKRIEEMEAKPAFKGYRGYPYSLCVSINEEIVHGIPSERKLKEGDIVSLDLGVYFRGYYGDAAITVGVGNISSESKKLLEVGKRALEIGISMAKEGNRISDISNAIQQFVEKNGFSVIRDFVGHGIGTSLHEDPQIPNFGPSGRGPRIKKGMVLAIEPMIAAGSHEVEILPDNWTAITKDRSRAAHFEHSVAVTNNGPLILSSLNREE